MEPLALAVFFVLMGLGMGYAARKTPRDLRDLWERAGAVFGLKLRSPLGIGTTLVLEGRCGELQVTAERREMRLFMRVLGPRIPPSLELDAETPLSRLLAKDDLTLGENAFDQSRRVHGAEAVVRAVLGPRQRELIREMFASNFTLTVKNQRLAYEVADPRSEEELEEILRSAILLAEALSLDDSQVPARLAENARSDDTPFARVQCLDSLSRMPGQRKLADETRIALLSDSVPAVRLAAAQRSGVADLEALLALAARERDTRARIGLLKHLTDFAGPRLWPAIKEALRSMDSRLQRAAADAAHATRYEKLAPRIARKIERHRATMDEKTLEALASALGSLRHAASEPTLVGLLSHESPEVVRTAAEALSEFAGVSAVEPLLAASERFRSGGDTKSWLLAAVSRIQARQGDHVLGAVSLAEQQAPVGALSVTESVEGAVSLVKKGKST